jgi:ParB family transcriptional regulator, chromosome partitioning protein
LQVEKIKVSTIERDPQQPRKLFDEAELMALAENLKSVGQQVPVIVYGVDGKFILLDGERRWRAAKLAGIDSLSAMILANRPSVTELAILQASIDVQRVSLSLMERSNVLARIRDENGWPVGELAERLSMKQPLVTKLLSYQKLAPGIQNLLHTGGLDGEKAYLISQEPDYEKQLALVKESAGMSREQVRAKLRQKPAAEQPRVKRAMFVLASGMSVTVQGIDATLEGVIESLSETIRELKRGLSQGLDVNTAQRVMRDKAKAKGA